MEDLIKITDAALENFIRIHSEDSKNEKKFVRLAVIGGGCSGLSYSIGFDEPKEKDNIVDRDGTKFLVDPKSSIYLKGITVDYKDGLQGKGFSFDNPNARNSCGCGESFTV
jgi:iron-sulfur cluster assembly protein